MKKAFVYAAVAAALSSTAMATDLTAWVIDGGFEKQYFAKLEKEFNARYAAEDIRVKLEPIPGYNEAIQAAWMSKDLPDIIMVDGPNMANYVWSGMLQPMDQLVSEQTKSKILPGVIAQGTYSPDNKLYMLSQGDSSVALWGNKAYLDKAGIEIPQNIDDAWTYDEFNAVLSELAALDEVRWPLDIKANYDGEWFTYGFYPFVRSQGGDIIDQSSWQAGGALDSKQTIAAVNRIKTWVDNKWIVPGTAGDNRFYGDKSAALAWVGNWMWQAHDKGLGEDLVLIPAPKFGQSNYSPNGGWGWAVPSTTKATAEVSKFLEFAFQPEQVAAYSEITGYIPAHNDAIGLVELFAEGGPLNVLAKQAQEIAVVRPVHPAYPVISGEFTKAMKNVVNGADTKTSLARAARNIDMDIEDNMGYPPFN